MHWPPCCSWNMPGTACLRAFALAVYPAWSTLPPESHMAHSQAFFISLFKCHLLSEVFSEHLFKFAASLLPPPTSISPDLFFFLGLSLSALLDFAYLFGLLSIFLHLNVYSMKVFYPLCLCTLLNLQYLDWCLAQCRPPINILGIKE